MNKSSKEDKSLNSYLNTQKVGGINRRLNKGNFNLMCLKKLGLGLKMKNKEIE